MLGTHRPDPRSSGTDEGQQDISDVYRNSTEDTVGELTLRGRSVRKRSAVSNHRPASHVNGGGPRRELVTSTSLSTITEGRQSLTTASTLGLPCASPGRHAQRPPSYPTDVRDLEQPATDPRRSARHFGALVAPLAVWPSNVDRQNGTLETPLLDDPATTKIRHIYMYNSTHHYTKSY